MHEGGRSKPLIDHPYDGFRELGHASDRALILRIRPDSTLFTGSMFIKFNSIATSIAQGAERGDIGIADQVALLKYCRSARSSMKGISAFLPAPRLLYFLLHHAFSRAC